MAATTKWLVSHGFPIGNNHVGTVKGTRRVLRSDICIHDHICQDKWSYTTCRVISTLNPEIHMPAKVSEQMSVCNSMSKLYIYIYICQFSWWTKCQFICQSVWQSKCQNVFQFIKPISCQNMFQSLSVDLYNQYVRMHARMGITRTKGFFRRVVESLINSIV